MYKKDNYYTILLIKINYTWNVSAHALLTINFMLININFCGINELFVH